MGFGASFNATVRSLVPLAPPHERIASMSAYFVCSYLAFSVPAVVAGLAVGVFGLERTGLGYGLVLVAMTGVVLAGVWRERRWRQGRLWRRRLVCALSMEGER